MRNTWLLLSFLILALSAPSFAAAEGIDAPPKVQGVPAIVSVQVVGNTTKAVPAKPAVYTFAVRGDGIFDLSSSASWLKFPDAISGKISTGSLGSTVIRFSVEENPGFTPREATVTIGPAALLIRQAGRPCAVMLPGGSRYFARGGETELKIDVDVTAGCTWRAEAEGPSRSMFPELVSDVAAKNLTVKINSLSGRSRRKGGITVIASDGHKAHIEIVLEKGVKAPRRAAKRDVLLKDYSEITVPAAGVTKKMKIVLEGEPYETISWEVGVEYDPWEEGGDWLFVEQESGTVKANKRGIAIVPVAVHVASNSAAYDRQGIVWIEATQGDITTGDTAVWITQEPKPCKIEGTKLLLEESLSQSVLPAAGAEAMLLIKVPEGCDVKVNAPAGFDWFWSDDFDEIEDEKSGEVIGYEATYLNDVFETDENGDDVYVGQMVSFEVEQNKHATRSINLVVEAGVWTEKETRDDYIEYLKVASRRKVNVPQAPVPGWTPCEINDMRISPEGVFPEEGADVTVLVDVPSHCEVRAEAPKSAFWLSAFETVVDDDDRIRFYTLTADNYFDDDGTYQGKILSFAVDRNGGKSRKTQVAIKAGEYDDVSETFMLTAKKAIIVSQLKAAVSQ